MIVFRAELVRILLMVELEMINFLAIPERMFLMVELDLTK